MKYETLTDERKAELDEHAHHAQLAPLEEEHYSATRQLEMATSDETKAGAKERLDAATKALEDFKAKVKD